MWPVAGVECLDVGAWNCNQRAPVSRVYRTPHTFAPPPKHPKQNGRLHYAKPTFHGEKLEDAPLYRGLSAIAKWREANRGARPQMVWVDTPPQVSTCWLGALPPLQTIFLPRMDGLGGHGPAGGASSLCLGVASGCVCGCCTWVCFADRARTPGTSHLPLPHTPCFPLSSP